MIKESRKTAGWILLFSFLVSLITLIIYVLESGFEDKELFLLLAIIRYSSFTVFISSMFFLITGIISLIKKVSVILIFQVFISILGVIYGAGIIVIDAFISTITNG
jgi:hypothetical protein